MCAIAETLKMTDEQFEIVMGVIGAFYQWVEKNTGMDVLSTLDKDAIAIYKDFAESFQSDDLEDFLRGFYDRLREKYKTPLERKVNYYAIIIPTLFDLHEDNEEMMEEIDEKSLSDPGVVAELLTNDEDISFEDKTYIIEIFGFKRMIENLLEKAMEE